MKNSIESFKRLYKYIKLFKGFLIAGIIMIVITAVTNALVPVIIGLAITDIGNSVLDIANGVQGANISYAYVTKIIVIFLVIGLITQVSQYFSISFMTNVVQGAMKNIRKDISEKINKLPVSYFDGKKQGDLLSIVTNDIDAISNALQQSAIQVITAILSIIFAVIMMFYISVSMALITILIIPLSILVSRKVIKKSQRYFVSQQDRLGELNGYIQEQYNGFGVVKLYNKEEDSIKGFREINEKLCESGFKATFISGLMMPLVGVVTNISYIGMSLLGGYYAVLGMITIGNLQAFIQYIWQVNQPLSQVTQLSGVLQTASAATMRIFKMLDESEEVEEKTSQIDIHSMEGNVSFNNISFGYNKSNTLIKDLSFSVKKGDKVAIVGPTGAGKTTIINLLMRFYDVNSGSIRIDGIDTKCMSRKDLRSLFGMVLQDAWLYSASIKENIGFGKLDATEEEIIKAAKTANVDGFIKTLPGGYNMVLNEETSNISQGQKQLLTIARAVISDPKILILDEATSSVDTRLELLIQRAMNSIMKGRTSFVIAHRLSTIRDADIILVMDKGNIVEFGNHEELLARKGFYEQLYNSQFSSSS